MPTSLNRSILLLSRTGRFVGTVKFSKVIAVNFRVLSLAASTKAIIFKLSAALIADSFPLSNAMSNSAIVPTKASGNQLLLHSGW